MTTTQQLKTLLEKRFGMGKVRISSRRGTAAVWITISIDCLDTPENLAAAQNIIAEWPRNSQFNIRLNWRGESYDPTNA
jgi:hypothetical protein